MSKSTINLTWRIYFPHLRIGATVFGTWRRSNGIQSVFCLQIEVIKQLIHKEINTKQISKQNI